MKIIPKLLNKSQEAFIVAIELYNKPTIKYRVEGFSFFIYFEGGKTDETTKSI